MSSVGSYLLLVLFMEIIGLILCCVLTVNDILVVVGGKAFSNLLIIVTI